MTTGQIWYPIYNVYGVKIGEISYVVEVSTTAPPCYEYIKIEAK